MIVLNSNSYKMYIFIIIKDTRFCTKTKQTVDRGSKCLINTLISGFLEHKYKQKRFINIFDYTYIST